jgi:transaldolase
MAKPAIEVRRLGQSIWLDSISRDMLTSGEFRRLVEQEGVSGCTSNPTIFDKAISGSSAYDDQIATLAAAGRDAAAIVDELARADLQDAADILRPVHDDTGGNDGFVSWEVSPELAYDTEATIREVRRLWTLLDRPNALIKIPATRAGLPAIHEMLYEGINVNITLLFSITRYEEVMEAYLSALERRLAEGKPVDRIRSVASFFVSRVDTLVDKQLDAMMERASPAERQRLAALRSKVAIANAKLAYQRFKQVFSGPRWQALVAHGAALQRPLWASTSTKDPSLPDTYYVDNLIGPHTVNTVPPHTLAAFNDHGRVAPTLEEGLAEAQEIMDRLAEVGIDIVAVTDQLEREGVRAFADSFVALRNTIDEKRARLRAGTEAAPRPF